MQLELRRAEHADIADLVELEEALFAADAGAHDPLVDTTWPRRRGADDVAALLGNEKALLLLASDAAGPCGHLVGWVSESSEVRRGVRVGYLRSYAALGFQTTSVVLTRTPAAR